MKYSIIVPIYNVEKYLLQCVESILKQSITDFELILVNDGSTDHCPELCDDFARRDSRVHVIHQPNAGLVAARQAGCRIARGEYVVCVDGDDWLGDDYLNDAEDLIGRYQPDIIASGFTRESSKRSVCIRNRIPEGFYEQERLAEIHDRMLSDYRHQSLRPGILSSLWGKIFKRELYCERQLLIDRDICIAEDVACVYGCLRRARTVYVSECTQYHYRITPGSLSRSPALYQWKNIKKVINHLNELRDGKGNEFQIQINLFALGLVHACFIMLYVENRTEAVMELYRHEDIQTILRQTVKVNMPLWGRIKFFALLHRLPVVHCVLFLAYHRTFHPDMIRKKR